MAATFYTIGGKTVQASQPYRPGATHLGELVARDEEMRMVVAAWMGGCHALPLSPLLLGEPGVGKNRLVYELARRTGKNLFVFQGHEDVTAEDLACMVRFSDDPEKKMDYVISPLVTAMKTGGICFIDEIAKFAHGHWPYWSVYSTNGVISIRFYWENVFMPMKVFASSPPPILQTLTATACRSLSDPECGRSFLSFILFRRKLIVSLKINFHFLRAR